MAAHEFTYLKTLGFVLTYTLGTEREEAAHEQEALEVNHAEHAKCSQHKKDKTNSADRPAQSDNEARPDSTVCYMYFLLEAFNSHGCQFTSQAIVTKANTQKVALVQRQAKVPPTLAWVQRSNLITSWALL